MTETAATETKRDKGPLEVKFLGADNKASTRVPEAVKALQITERATNKTKIYDFSEFPQNVLAMLAAAGAKKLMETYARNSVDEHGTNILDSTDFMFATLKDGKLYTRTASEDGTATRPSKFDFDFWIEVAKVYGKRKLKKEPTSEQLASFKAKLEALTPKARTEYIANSKKDPTFKAAYLSVQAQKTVKGADKDDETLDLF